MSSTAIPDPYTLPPALRDQFFSQPVLPPPEGVVSNFDNPPNDNPMGYGVATVSLALASLFGLLRVYSRGFVIRQVDLADAFGIAAFLCYIGLSWSMYSYMHECGVHIHGWNLHLKNGLNGTRDGWTFPIFYMATMMLAKTAILLEWTRIFFISRTAIYWAGRGVIAINVLLYTSLLFVTIFYCHPVYKLWRPWVDGHCLARAPIDTCVAAFNLFIDVLILAWPQKVIWQLKRDTSRKIGVSIVFSIGLLALGCAVGRMYLVTQLDYSGDILYALSTTFVLAYVEVALVLMVFFIPAAPRAFGSDTLVAKMVITLRSWRGIGSSRGRSDGSDNSNSHPYDGNNQGEGNERSYDTIDNVPMLPRQPDQAHSQPGPQDSKGTHIWKTTNFEQSSDAASNKSRELR